MNNKNKDKKLFIENMFRSLIETDTTDKMDEKDTDLILRYLNDDLSNKEKKKIDERMSDDKEFKFLIDIIKFESQRDKPSSFLSHYLLKIKLFFRQVKQPSTDVDSAPKHGMNDIIIPAPIAAKTLSSYLTPALSIGLVLFFVLQLQPISYNFNQFDYSRNLFDIGSVYRSYKDTTDLSYDALDISHDEDTLAITWVNKNESIVANLIVLADEGYLVTDNELKIFFPLKEKLLVRLYNNFTQQKDDDKVWSEKDTLIITKVELISINQFPENFKFNPAITDYDSLGKPIVEKTFLFNINN